MIFNRSDTILILRNLITKSVLFITLILSTLLLLSQLVYAYISPITLQADSNYEYINWGIVDSNYDVIIDSEYDIFDNFINEINENINLSDDSYIFFIDYYGFGSYSLIDAEGNTIISNTGQPYYEEITFDISGTSSILTITGSPDTIVIKNSTYSFTPTVYGNDGNALTFSIINKPIWAAFNNSTGALTGIPTAGGTTTGIEITVNYDTETATLAAFDINVTNSSRIFTTPNYPNNYPNSQNITETLSIPGASSINVSVSGVTESNYDYIEILDSTGNQLSPLKRFDGIIDENFVVGGDTIQVRFTSDGSVIETGVIVTITNQQSSSIVYVQQGATGNKNGTSWQDAYSDLQIAIEKTNDKEIWVASGVYKPTTDNTQQRTATFQLKNGVALYGGFNGTETNRDARNWNTNKTILSGDIEGDNVYTVVTGNGIDNSTILDGFTITGGLANVTDNIVYNSGAGISNFKSSATLANLKIEDNEAIKGGGIYNDSSSNPTLTNIVFSRNTATENGGGIYNASSNPTLINVVFSDNTASNNGGGIYNFSGEQTLTNITISGNNTQQNGSGIYNESGILTLKNVIVWGNTTNENVSQIKNNDEINISYSLIQGGCSLTGCGDNNINADPLFVDESTYDLRLSNYSSAIDSGNNNVVIGDSKDLAGNQRIHNDVVDIGAYENNGSSDLKSTALKATVAFFVERKGSNNPFYNINDNSINSIPIFADPDKDNDFDAVIGNYDGTIRYYQNINKNFQKKDGIDNPFNDIDVGKNSSPTLIDIDDNNDFDVFLGEYDGTIDYYKGDGTLFQSQNDTNNLLDSVDVQKNSVPTFVDIDKDSDLDVFIGSASSTSYFENIGNIDNTNTPKFEQQSGIENPLYKLVVGEQNKLAFVDIDKDGDFDVFIGQQDGAIKFYENTGTAHRPNFVQQVDLFANIHTGERAAPTFIDWNEDEYLDMFVGQKDGTIKYYENIGTVIDERFLNQGSVFKKLSIGKRSTPTLIDIDDDGDLDAFIGERDGIINYYKNIGDNSNPLFVKQQDDNPFKDIDFGDYSHPTFADIDDDGDFDAFIGIQHDNDNIRIKYYENTSSVDTLFFKEEGMANPLRNISLSNNYYSKLNFVDIDNDDDLDVFIGSANGTIEYYPNEGTNKIANFSGIKSENNPFKDITIGKHTAPMFIDFDKDNDFDVFIGEEDGIIKYFENIGTEQIPQFVEKTDNPFIDVKVKGYSVPFLADIDNDGNLDALIGETDGTIQHYEYSSIGSALPRGGSYNFAPKVSLKCVGCNKFYYTTDGSIPTVSSTEYTGPIEITKDTTTTLKYISSDDSSKVFTETYVVDTTKPEVTGLKITPESESNNNEYTNLETISGTVTNITKAIGLDYVEFQMHGNGKYLTKDDEWITESTWIKAEISKTDTGWSYNYEFEEYSKDADKETGVSFAAGNYTIQVRAANKLENVSDTFVKEIGIAKAYTTLYLESNSTTILNGGEVILNGKLNRFPTTTEDLSEKNITLKIVTPNEKIVTVSATTHTDTGQFTFTINNSTENFDGLKVEGAYRFKVEYAGDDKLAGSESLEEQVLVGTSAGYAILVHGKLENEEGLSAHKKTTNRIYKALKERGFEDNNLYYFNYSADNSAYTDDKVVVKNKEITVISKGEPSKTAIGEAFVDIKNKMNVNPAPLYLIMVDHGKSDGTFHIYNENNTSAEDNVIIPSEINEWLTTLEGKLETKAKTKARLVILGACYSGSFISKLSQSPIFNDPDDPKTLTNAGRIIITSATAQEESYKGLQEPDGIRSGEFFMEELFIRLNKGDNVRDAFEFATEKTENFTRKGDGNTDNSFFDEAMQHPLLDDDGDGQGSNSLAAANDGFQAKDIFLGFGAKYNVNSTDNPSEIISVSDTIYLSASDDQSAATLIANVNKASRINSAIVDIRKPTVVLNGSGTESSGQLEVPDLERLSMNCSNTDNSCVTSYDKFTEKGKYEAFYVVRDNETNDISSVKRSVIYKNYVGNEAPDSFDLTYPNTGGKTKEGKDPHTSLIFVWQSSKDSDSSEPVTYKLIIAEDANFNNVVHKQEELEIAMTYVDEAVGLKDLTTYYWKVEAVDTYGAVTSSNPTDAPFSFKTNNTNDDYGIWSSNISSDIHGTSVTGLEFFWDDNTQINDGNIYSNGENHNVELPKGRRMVRVKADGHKEQEVMVDNTKGTSQLIIQLESDDKELTKQYGKLQFSTTTVDVSEKTGTAAILVNRANVLNMENEDLDVTVKYVITDGTAKAGSDYTNSSKTLSWSATDQLAKSINIPITDDEDYEGDEIFTITLSSPSPTNATLGIATLTVTIKDDESKPDPMPGILQFSSDTYSATEGDSTLNLNVTRTDGSDGKASVQYMVNGSAALDSDYTGGSGILVWDDKDSIDKSLTFKLIDDDEIESVETLSLTLFNLQGDVTLGDEYQVTFGSKKQATLNIADNDKAGIGGVLQFSAANYTAKEGSNTIIDVSRTDGSDGEISVQYSATGESTAMINIDYINSNGILTWKDGDSSTKSFTINVHDDNEAEGTEIIKLMLSNPTGEATLSSPAQTTISITDNDVAEEPEEPVETQEPTTSEPNTTTVTTPDAISNSGSGTNVVPNTNQNGVITPNSSVTSPSTTYNGTASTAGTLQFSLTTYLANEGDNDFQAITVNRLGNGKGDVSVQYFATANSSATSEIDYIGGFGTLYWADGDMQPKVLPIVILDDVETESLETVNLMLSNPTGQATLGSLAQTTLIIVDSTLASTDQATVNPEAGSLQFSNLFYTISEDIGITTLDVVRTGGSKGKVSIRYITLDNGTASFNYDYVGGTDKLIWEDGDTTARPITIMLFDDQQVEDLETIHLILTEPAGGAVLGAPERATLVVVDNDGQLPIKSQESSSQEEVAGYSNQPNIKYISDLPDLGRGEAVTKDGSVQSADVLAEMENTTVNFWGGAAVNNQEYQTNLSTTPSKMVKIMGEIGVADAHIGQEADILVVVAGISDYISEKMFFMLNDEEQFQVWDGELVKLISNQENVVLSNVHTLKIYHGFIEPVQVKIYFGYRLKESGSIYFNGEQPIEVEVVDDSANKEPLAKIWHSELSPNGKQIVTASSDGHASLWDANNGNRLAKLTGHTSEVKTATFSPDGSKILTGSADNTARIWDVAESKELAVLQGHTNQVEHASFSPDGQLIVTASADNTAQLWNIDGEKLFTLQHEQGVQYATLSNDGKQIITVASNTAHLWNVETGTENFVLIGHKDMIEHAAFSHDDQYLVTTSWDNTARIWDVNTGLENLVLKGHNNGITYAIFSPADRYVVTTSWDNTVRLWDAKTGEPLWIREHQAGINHASFSPDGQMIVTGSNDDTARLWETATGKPIKTLLGHDGNVWQTRFSLDGKQIITASWDNTVRVWDVESGEMILRLRD
ncbi:Calx-beta domain-containing protein [Candidatus Halobeggiatoa sp. HSG11]|nr:Calx-beta domain-containing protein [Candidatus Halobeggiatoa sp. HSG11]